MATYTIDNIKLPNGDICNIQDTTYTIATGDSNGQIKVTPSSGSAYNVNVKGLGTAAYKNTTNTYAYNGTDPITGTGVYNALYEANLRWGNTSKNGALTPVGMSLSMEHNPNRLAFINGDLLTFEYSSNGGSTWTDYGYTAGVKSQFCTTSTNIPIGRPDSTTVCTTSCRTRITLTAQDGNDPNNRMYTNPRKMLIKMQTANGVSVLIEYRTGTNYLNDGEWVTFGTYTVSGNSGWNDIPLILGTLGGGITQTNNNWQLRLTFIVTSVASSESSQKNANVSAIRIYGENAWVTPSTMANTNHLYSFDMSQNATFPATVTATNYIISANDITIANGDKLVVTDSSNSNKVSHTSLSFDGSTSTKCLTQKGTWETFSNNSGTVTSVAASGNNGISISGSPITSSGTITIGLNLSTAINGLSEGTSSATANDYIVAQYAGGGTSNTTYYRRKVGKILDALTSTQVVTALGYTPPTENTTYTANTTSIGSASGWSAGTKPSLSYTSRSIPNVTAANTPTTAVISGGILTFTAGTALTLGTAISADDITSWSDGTTPSLTVTSTTVATGITAT